MGRQDVEGFHMDEPYLLEAAIAAFYELLDTEGRALFGALLGALLVSAARDLSSSFRASACRVASSCCWCF